MSKKKTSSSLEIDWEKIFETKYPQQGITEKKLLTQVEHLQRPLTKTEIKNVIHPRSKPDPNSSFRFDPTQWVVPNSPLPQDYLSFLKWSNGGSFFNSDRAFDIFLPIEELRDYLLANHFPQYLANVLPFATDGRGGWYIFDMRSKPRKGEYPILYVDSGNFQFEATVVVASRFIELCQGTTDPREEMYG